MAMSLSLFGTPGCSVRPVRPCRTRRPLVLLVRSSTAATASTEELYTKLKAAYDAHKDAPLSQKFDFSKDILTAMQDLKAAGANPKWGASSDNLQRRNVFQGELRQVGIKNPDKISTPSVRNDLAFLVTVTLSTSFFAVLAGAVLPGDWGFFTSYLIGGITLAVLAVGSTAPGLLQYAIDLFSQVYPDYRARVVRHEAAHLLLGYLMGVPVTSYSLMIGKEHTEFAEAKIQKRLIERNLEDSEIDQMAVVAVAGIAAEGQQYEEIMGQTADLFDLQRILLRAKTRMSDQQQQNITYKKEHQAVIQAMERGAGVMECVQAIENA